MKEQNPDYSPVKDGEWCGAGWFDGEGSYVDKWDAQNHAIRREYTSGRTVLLMMGMTPAKPNPCFVPIIYKRPAK